VTFLSHLRVKGPYPTTYGTREEVGSEKGQGEQTDQVLGGGGKDYQGIRLHLRLLLRYSLQGHSRTGNNEERNKFMQITRSVQRSPVSCELYKEYRMST